MKTFTLVLLCSLVCVACARPLKTLSDGQPGYAVTCDTWRDRCLEEITLICQGKKPITVSERAQEVRQDIRLPDSGPFRTGASQAFNSRYWMEVRCEDDVKAGD